MYLNKENKGRGGRVHFQKTMLRDERELLPKYTYLYYDEMKIL